MSSLSDWQLNVLGIYNFRRPGKLRIYFDWLKANHDRVAGDIVEAGVFKGKSILATALFLKSIGSKKKIYGYDSFFGFPEVYHHNDELARFDDLFADGAISKEHYIAHKKLVQMRKILRNEEISVKNISSSEEFESNNIEMLNRKIDYLNLDNIVLVDGPFSETMKDDGKGPKKICSAILDCDLYESYQIALTYAWRIAEKGAFVFLDEYYSLKFAGARISCDEFFSNKSSKPSRALGLDDDFERWFAVK